MNITVADLLIQRIAEDAIDTIFGVTGGGIMYLIDSIARSENVRLIPTHHEEFAGVAADGYARSGKPYGVAIGTAGPGAAHLFTAVSAAWQDSSPVLFIAGQVKTDDTSTLQSLSLRQNGTFEFDTTKAFAPITKHIVILKSAKNAANDIEYALQIMQQGRPGPVVIEIPLDIQGAMIEPPQQKQISRTQTISLKSNNDIAKERISIALSNSNRPLVLLGIGAIRAGVNHEIVKALNKSGIPYICTQFARAAGHRGDKLFLGSPGIKANRSANIAMMSCDTLIAIGSSLHQQVIGWDSDQFKNSPAHKIWFELDPDVLSARSKLVDESFELSAQDTADVLITELENTGSGQLRWVAWLKLTEIWRSNYLLHYPVHDQVKGRMCLYRLISALDKHADQFAAVTTDAGQAWYALAQHYFMPEGAHYISSGSFGAMGMALPLAIGSAAATRGAVLAVTGDGSAMMSLSELATLRAQNLPVLLVINNNDGYVSIRSTHDRYFDGRKIGTDFSNGVFIPNFESVSITFEIPYFAARSEAELEQILDQLFDQALTGPVLLEVYTYTDQVVEPLVTSRRGSDGRFQSTRLDEMDPPVEILHA